MRSLIQNLDTVFSRVGCNHTVLLLGGLFLLTTWFASKAAGEQAVDADNIVVVLDASGSMSTQMSGASASRIDIAKSALQEVVKQIPAETNFGLIVFGGTGRRGNWVYPLSPVDSVSFRKGLADVTPTGGTPLGQFIMLGANRLLEQREAQHNYGTYRLIIVTDGEASDPALVKQYTLQALTRGITLEVIGVDMMTDHSLAKQVNAYRRADDPASLNEALVSSIAEISLNLNDTAGEEGFALIAALPDGCASAVLDALRQSGNDPIGGPPRSATQPSDVSQGSAPALNPSQTPKNSPVVSRGNGVSIAAIVFIVVIFAVIFQIFQAATKGRSRG